MAVSRNIEEGKGANQRELDETASMPSKTSKSGCYVVPIDASVASKVETITERHRAEDSLERQTPLCCRSFCDLLRACIICDIIFIVLDIVGIILFLMGITINNTLDFSNREIYDDDVYDEVLNEALNEAQAESDRNTTIELIIKNCLGMFFCTIGIIGAANFNKTLVFVTAIWFCIDCIWSMINTRWTGIVVTACFAYPHFALFMALKKGTIASENYARERFCCCDA